MWQKQIYFFSYMICWGIGITQILVYLLCHQVLTGVNYSYFYHSRELTEEESKALDEMDEYLVGLSDSSDSGENSNEGRWLSFEELNLIFYSNYQKEDEKEADEIWTVWLDPILKHEKIIETRCEHFFHKHCIKTSYLRGNEQCPNWRKILRPEEEYLRIKSDQNVLLNDSFMTRSSFNSTIDT